MSKVLIYSDLHVAHKFGPYITFLAATVDHLIEQIKVHRPDAVVNLGDTLDTFGTLNVADGLYAQALLDKITDAMCGGPHIVLRGNHDTADKAGQISSGPLVCRKASVVLQPTCATLCGMPVLYLPYSTDLEMLKDSIVEAKKYGVRAVFTHTDWLGCQLTPAYVSREGLEPAWVGETLPGVPIFAGHYHQPCQIGPVHVVGSPLYLNFSDVMSDQDRGFTLWDTTGETIRIANSHSYRCVRLDVGNKRELLNALKSIDNPGATKLKVYIPKKFVEAAQELVKGYLWSAVYPVADEQDGVPELAKKVTLRTSPEDAVRAAIKTVPDGLDGEMLLSLGLQAFRRLEWTSTLGGG